MFEEKGITAIFINSVGMEDVVVYLQIQHLIPLGDPNWMRWVCVCYRRHSPHEHTVKKLPYNDNWTIEPSGLGLTALAESCLLGFQIKNFLSCTWRCQG